MECVDKANAKEAHQVWLAARKRQRHQDGDACLDGLSLRW